MISNYETTAFQLRERVGSSIIAPLNIVLARSVSGFEGWDSFLVYMPGHSGGGDIEIVHGLVEIVIHEDIKAA